MNRLQRKLSSMSSFCSRHIGSGDADGDLAHYNGILRVVDVHDQDARMNVLARTVRCGGGKDRGNRTRGIQISAGIGTVAPVPDVEEVVEDGQRGIHAAIEQRVAADELEILRGTGRAATWAKTHV